MEIALSDDEIAQYTDYRDFLRDRFEREKRRRRSFSFQYCAARLGTSKAYLKLVIGKRRHVGLRKVPRLWTLFRLTPFERQFFTLLVLRTVPGNEELAAHFDHVLDRLRHRLHYAGTYEGAPSSEEKEVIFRGALHMTLHALARTEGFRPEVAWVRARLTGVYADAEIERALRDLIANGSIVRDEGGAWRRDAFAFRMPDEFDDDHFKIYRVGLRRASDALDAVSRHGPGQFHMMTLPVNAADAAEALRLSIEFRDHLIELSERSRAPDRVMFLSNNAFCVAKEPVVAGPA